MKPIVAAATLAVLAAHLPAAETVASAPLSATDRIALDCLSHDITDDQLVAALAKEGIGAGAMLDRIKARLKPMRAAKDEGVNPNSKWFWARVEEIEGKGAPSQNKPAITVTNAGEARSSSSAVASIARGKSLPPEDQIEYERLQLDERAIDLKIARAMAAIQDAEKTDATPEAKKKGLDAAKDRKQLDLAQLENRAKQASLLADAAAQQAATDAKVTPTDEKKIELEKARAEKVRAKRDLDLISAVVKELKDDPAKPKVEAREAAVVKDDDKQAYEILQTEEAALKAEIATFTAIASSATAKYSEKAAANRKLLDLQAFLEANTAYQTWLRDKYTLATASTNNATSATEDTRSALEKATKSEAQTKMRRDAAQLIASNIRNAPPDDSSTLPKARSTTYPQLLEKEMKLKNDIGEQEKIAADNQPTKDKADAAKLLAANLKISELKSQLLENRANQLRLRAAANYSSLSTTKDAAPKLDWIDEKLQKAKEWEDNTAAIHKSLEEKLKGQANDPKRTPFAFTHGGLRMQAPYVLNLEMIDDPASDDPAKKIQGTDYILSSDGTKVGGFLEFVYTNVWAWRPSRQAESIKDRDEKGTRFQYMGAGFLNEKNGGQTMGGLLDNAWDSMGRVSFEFGKDDKPSASTITGSGDFNAEITFDKHLLRGFSADDKMAFTGSLSFTVGGVTDKSTFEVHPRLMGGLAMAMSFDDPFSALPVPRKVWYRMQGGIARIDSLQFADNTSMKIKSERPGLPLYEPDRSALALETELFWPIREGGLVALGTRLYGKVRPSPWSLYLSVTIPIAPIIDSASPK